MELGVNMKKIIVSIIILLFVYQIHAQSGSEKNRFLKLSDNSIALGEILKSLMPVMMFNSNNQAELTQVVEQDTVIEEVLLLLKQGVRIDSLRIIDFKNAKTQNYGGFSQITAGEFGKLVSVNNGGNGITLIEYCEEIKCFKIVKLFLDEIAKINESYFTTNKELSELRLKAEKGEVNSQIELGNKFFNGIAPFEKDYIGAMKWFQMAANNASAEAQYTLAKIYLWKKIVEDVNKAFQLFVKSAELGNANALNMVGMCYCYGYGVAKDYAEAIKWWLKASEVGNSEAQASLGYFYENGIGVVQDYTEAIKWYTKSAEQGQTIAQGRLGVIYFKGLGVPKDYNESIKWLTKGAELGDETCREDLEYVKTQMDK